jgi:hypothetical protein
VRVGCVAIVKNEARYIAEWIAFQLAIGFDSVLIFDNGSTDNTLAQIARFQGRYDVRVMPWPDTSFRFQQLAYEEGLRRFRSEFDWLAFFDIDEFLVMNESLKLKKLLSQISDADSIACHFSMFGSSGHKTIQNGLVIENFTQRSDNSFGPNRHVKCIVRPKRIEHCVTAHYFTAPVMRDFLFWKRRPAKIVDLRGCEMKWGSTPGISANPPDYSVGKLNHYFVRSLEDWKIKMARGYQQSDLTRSLEEFKPNDRNEVIDTSAAQWAAAVREILKNCP